MIGAGSISPPACDRLEHLGRVQGERGRVRCTTVSLWCRSNDGERKESYQVWRETVKGCDEEGVVGMKNESAWLELTLPLAEAPLAQNGVRWNQFVCLFALCLRQQRPCLSIIKRRRQKE